MNVVLPVLVGCSRAVGGYSLRRPPTPHAFASVRHSLLRSVWAFRSLLTSCCKAFSSRATSQPKLKRYAPMPTLAQNSVSCDQVSVYADQRATHYLQTVTRRQRTSIREWKTLKFSRSPQSALLCFQSSAVEGKIADWVSLF